MADLAPLFTVVVPLYNTERYIAETLDCILAQTCQDFEIVVVNDASSDQGPAIVETYRSRDPRVRMVTQDNRGLAGARNTGIRHARGRYLALLDADDLWTPDKLALHRAHLDARPEVGVSYAGSAFIDEAGARLGLAQRPKLAEITPEDVFCRNPVGNGSAAVIRREALDAVMFEIAAPEGARQCWFDETFRQSEDIEIWLRIAASTSWRFEGIEGNLTLYRVNTGGLSANVERQLESWLRVRGKLESYAPWLVAAAGRRAYAYQLRYLARRASMNGDGATALRLAWRALSHHPHMLIEEPSRTLQTICFSAAARLLPAGLFAEIKAMLLKPRPAHA